MRFQLGERAIQKTENGVINIYYKEKLVHSVFAAADPALDFFTYCLVLELLTRKQPDPATDKSLYPFIQLHNKF